MRVANREALITTNTSSSDKLEGSFVVAEQIVRLAG
jgi:hypothetical protein